MRGLAAVDYCNCDRRPVLGVWRRQWPAVSRGVVIDIVRTESGILAEHRDVIQNEATEADSKSGKPMFGNSFPAPTAK